MIQNAENDRAAELILGSDGVPHASGYLPAWCFITLFIPVDL
jgi:hypothetical protein